MLGWEGQMNLIMTSREGKVKREGGRGGGRGKR